MTNSQVIAVIPARYDSSRFPGKLLEDLAGKSVLQRVFEQCIQAKSIDKILIATDHDSILSLASSFGADTIKSNEVHVSGTDRIAEVVKLYDQYTYIVNIQGDEPFIDPENIDLLVALMKEKKSDIATLAIEMDDASLIQNPNIVKLVTDCNDKALFFSRAQIPFLRDQHANTIYNWKKHIGVYGFKRDTLLNITKLPVSYLEKTENLEQLRWLENGYQIHVGMIKHHSIGIDTKEDLKQAIEYAHKHNL